MQNSDFIDLLTQKTYAYKLNNGTVVVQHKGNVHLGSLTTLPEGVSFENKGNVRLGSLTTLPEGTSFENKGHVYLSSLTTLPEGTSFENKGNVFLDSLTGKHKYLGKSLEFQYIDGFTMVMGASKTNGDYEVVSARYFSGGPLRDMKKCYIAKSNGLYAHGKTIKAAIDDLQYKIADNADKAEIAADIRKSGRVTVVQFRALTGACRDGIRQHLEPLGINIDKTDSLSLPDAIKAMAGTSYGSDFKSILGDLDAGLK